MIFIKIKTFILIVISIVIIILVKNKTNNVIIPKESIRIRIIANTNDDLDVKAKEKVKKNVERELYLLLKSAKNVKEAKQIISDNLERLNLVIDKTTNIDYNIKFGYNYFPKKIYKGVVYESGNYDSLIITLGKGMGNNWWCVLFPPLCLLDENDTTKDVEYKFFVKELIDKFIS